MLVTGSYHFEEIVSSMVCGWPSVDGGTVPPATLIALPLDVVPLMICFLRAIVDVEEDF